ncbi:MAG: ABC transporter permease [Tissierellia bacterium]|nr:ABC transporter permease [Tissierellia bacterium]
MKNKTVYKQGISLFITLLISTLFLFTLIRLAPGDPVKTFLGTPETSSVSSTNYQERYDELKKELLLDKSITSQYIAWVKKAITLDLGYSIYSKQSVSYELLNKLPATLLLTIPAIIFQMILGVLLGVLSAIYNNTAVDSIIRIICSFLASIPGFALGLILIYIFSVVLNMYEISTNITLSRLWLPAFTLGLISSPGIIRVVRTTMLEEMGKQYVGFLINIGASQKRITINIMRNIILPIISINSTYFANLVGGSVVIENVFSWPGIGKYAMDSILKLDYPVIQGYGLLMVILVIMFNMFVDKIYRIYNPAIKMGRESGEKSHV